MQFQTPLFFLAAIAPLSMALPHGQETSNAKREDWTSTPSSGQASTSGFGGRSDAGSGTVDTYEGNTGGTWGSNIMEISSSDAPDYKYVAEISGNNNEEWKVVFWNKIGSEGKLAGHYGQSALEFDLGPGETKYVAFDENTQGAMGAASGELPTSDMGAYAVTYGEFDFGNGENGEWSGFDVSAIQVQLAGEEVQGMQICDALGSTCSSITADAGEVNNAYTKDEQHIGGIGGNLSDGAARLAVVIGYDG